jgi:hypothetical protein
MTDIDASAVIQRLAAKVAELTTQVAMLESLLHATEDAEVRE